MADDAALLDVLREVIDPELMINIVDLGLVYDIEQVDNKVIVQMTLTSPACPGWSADYSASENVAGKAGGRLRGGNQTGDEPAVDA